MNSDLTQDYKKLVDRFHEVSLLSSASAVLRWDEKVNLPDQGIPFPTYTLGTLNAAQLYHTALKQIPGPGLEHELAAGDYESLRIWLKENVYRHGRRYTPDELMRRATGETTNARFFTDYLRAKF